MEKELIAANKGLVETNPTMSPAQKNQLSANALAALHERLATFYEEEVTHLMEYSRRLSWLLMEHFVGSAAGQNNKLQEAQERIMHLSTVHHEHTKAGQFWREFADREEIFANQWPTAHVINRAYTME